MGVVYPDGFLRLWREYGSPKNSSKSKAYEAYRKAQDKPSDELLLHCIAAYCSFIRENSRYREYPKCHMATWLNQGRWESFMDDAEKALTQENKHKEAKDADVQASGQTWPAEVIGRLGLPDAVLRTWILPCALIQSQPAEVVAPRKFHAQWLREKFLDRLQRVLGDGVKITYAS